MNIIGILWLKDEAITTYHYKAFGMLFEQHVPRAEKKDLLHDRLWKNNAHELEHSGK